MVNCLSYIKIDEWKKILLKLTVLGTLEWCYLKFKNLGDYSHLPHCFRKKINI